MACIQETNNNLPVSPMAKDTANHVSSGTAHTPHNNCSRENGTEDGEDSEVSQEEEIVLDMVGSSALLDRRRCSQTLTDAKEHAYARLMAELSNAQKELQLRDEECEKLCKLRGQMEAEIEELTASLFEEANKSIQEAHVKRMKAEKLLKDATNQIDILQGEVDALKHLVVTSTPSSPNKHLHPQISNSTPTRGPRPFWKKHRRSTSHHEFSKEGGVTERQGTQQNGVTIKEVDGACFEEFKQWHISPCITDASSEFLCRIFREDIQPCLNFTNRELADRVLQCVQQNSLSIEPVSGSNTLHNRCSLSNTLKMCNYKIKLEEDEEWYSISQLCRNRIAAVCDFYTYIRYICQKLVKCADSEMFQEITKLRLQMAAARLGC